MNQKSKLVNEVSLLGKIGKERRQLEFGPFSQKPQFFNAVERNWSWRIVINFKVNFGN